MFAVSYNVEQRFLHQLRDENNPTGFWFVVSTHNHQQRRMVPQGGGNAHFRNGVPCGRVDFSSVILFQYFGRQVLPVGPVHARPYLGERAFTDFRFQMIIVGKITNFPG